VKIQLISPKKIQVRQNKTITFDGSLGGLGGLESISLIKTKRTFS
jgi:hypothetical protein